MLLLIMIASVTQWTCVASGEEAAYCRREFEISHEVCFQFSNYTSSYRISYYLVSLNLFEFIKNVCNCCFLLFFLHFWYGAEGDFEKVCKYNCYHFAMNHVFLLFVT